MGPPSRLPGFAKVLLLLAVFLTSAEFFTRLDDWIIWGAPMLQPYDHDHLLVQDSLGLRGRPGYRFEKWRMNNLGFRGPDLLPISPASRLRIAILGASESFGLYESEGHEYPIRMQALADSLAPGRFQIVNVSLPGLTLASMSVYFQRVVAPIRPDYVLIYPSPSFYLETRPLPFDYTPPRLPASAHREETGFVSRLAPKAREVLRGLFPPVLLTSFRAWSLDRTSAARDSGWVWQAVPPDRMALLQHHLSRLLAVILASGAEPILVTHTNRFIGMTPSQVEGDRRHLVNLRANYYPRASSAVLIGVDSAANRVLREVAEAEALPLIEVEGKLAPGGASFADYAHFTDAGAASMARILVPSLLAIVNSKPGRVGR